VLLPAVKDPEIRRTAGTSLYKRLKQEGRLSGLASNNTDGKTNIIPRMELKVLCEGYKKIMCRIYSPKHYYDRVRTFLQEYKTPETEIHLDFQRFMAFFRSRIQLGVFGRERFQYRKLLSWTLRKLPELLHLAITFAIYGHHFRRICELHII
jgi:hypothetical protein